MTGTIVNAAAIVAGTAIGLLFRKGISESANQTVMNGIGLAVALIGFKMAFKTENELIVILSLVLGGIIGEILDIEGWLGRIGTYLETKIGAGEGEVARAFVTTSLIYCVGAMAIMGALEDGLTGNATTLYAKSLLDGTSAVIFTSTMGFGVAFSAIPVLIYQGAITLAADFLKSLLNPGMINEMTATGGLLIVGIASNVLGIKKIKVGNLLPAILVAVFLSWLWQKLNINI
ncbi:DUF554 domain-containing protein [Desulforamulus hydrothermalis]|uniref:DUF554 domain-containing protein n=1 Tax=Desulforamulus hydrothermalis Lam5 = DSM 18033 TaxID=1121428 RepID=K8DZ93_9FIRM|nr:DUF554 domain-containing protein [Desulforamulus hydrothermalis]CCO08329.1 conserved membrane hypothetical protein [Desulforamulus hydrothermalis Lam5 = DSM 18033]SHH45140.1 hypothetical protein SAMN02745177_02592 [Desulforamulus hydrothermalis Lam5 = DSM 18033]